MARLDAHGDTSTATARREAQAVGPNDVAKARGSSHTQATTNRGNAAWKALILRFACDRCDLLYLLHREPRVFRVPLPLRREAHKWQRDNALALGSHVGVGLKASIACA